MEFQILGIDIAKNKFDCSFIAAPNSPNGRKAKSKVLPNHPAGFAGLITWLVKNNGADAQNIKVFMEATGVYHEALAEFLYAQGFAVYVFNLADAAAYIRSDNLHKTDKSDARALADMGIDRLAKASRSLHSHKPREWLSHTPYLRARQTLRLRCRVCAVCTHAIAAVIESIRHPSTSRPHQSKSRKLQSMSYNRQKMENALLALIGALEFEDGRFWKGYDFDLLNSLHEQGLISQPWGKAKSAYLTPEGLEKAKALAEEMFGEKANS